jgi:hypothetical protein
MSMEMNWGFTATRNPLTAPQWKWLHELLDPEAGVHEIHHGACINGDEMVHFCAVSAAIPVIYIHPPVNQRLMSTRVFATPTTGTVVHVMPAKPYHARNHDIVDTTERLFALPDGYERLHSGTWSTVRYARHLHKHIDICYPDGTVKPEGPEVAA